LETKEGMTRRDFIAKLTVVGAATAVLPMVSGAASAEDAVPYAPAGGVALFNSTDFVKAVLPDGTGVYIRKNTDSTYTALSSKCTHRGCEVLWTPTDKLFECPCHHGEFDPTGAVVKGPPRLPLPSYATKVANGTVLVQA